MAEAEDQPGWRQRAVSRSLSSARSRAEQRVQRLMTAAFELIDEKGTSEFTIQEVVDRSKQSLRAFYQYFDGKDELLFALLEESIRESLEDLREAVEAESEPLDRLRAFIVRLHEWCEPLGTRRKRGAHNRVPMSEFSIQLALKDPESVGAATAPISRMLVDAARRGRGRRRDPGRGHAAHRDAHAANRHVRLAHESPRQEHPRAGDGRGRLGVLPPRPRRLKDGEEQRMKSPVIVAAARTPIGRARKGSLVSKDAFELAQVVVRAVVERSKIDPREIDDIVIAESLQGGGVIARHTAVVLGLENASRAWRRTGTARPASARWRPPPDRSRPAWIASSSPAAPRA